MNKNLEKVKVLMGEEMFQKYFERIQEVLKVFGVEVPEDWEYPIQKLEYLSHFNKYVLVDISDKEKLGNRDKIVISLPAPTKSKSSDNLKKEASSAKIKIKDWGSYHMVEAVIEIESKTYKWDKWTHPNNKSDEVADPVCGETLSIYQNEKNLSMEFLEYRTLKTSEMSFYDFSYPRITSTVKEVELDYFGSKEYKIEEYPCVLENALNDEYFQGKIKDMNIKEEIPIIMGIFTPPINNMIESLKNEDSTFRRENQKRYLRELRKKAIERASKEYARSVTDANKAFLNGVKRLTREIPTPVGNNND